MEDWAKSIKIINAPPSHPAILFLGIYPTNMLTLEQKHTCVRVLTAALLRKGGWIQSGCPRFSPWMNELSHAHAQSLQSCPTLCDPMDHSPPCSFVHGILQVRTLVWVVVPSSRGCSRPRNETHTSYVSYIGRQVLYH